MLVYLNVSTCVLMSFVFCYPGFSIRRNDLISVEVYSGWWFFALPLWQMMEFVNGKDDNPYMKRKNESHVPNHQPVLYIHGIYIYTYDPCMYIHITCNICLCLRICMCMCLYVSMYMYAYVYMYTTIYIYIYVLCYICNVPIPKLWQHSPRRLHPTP